MLSIFGIRMVYFRARGPHGLLFSWKNIFLSSNTMQPPWSITTAYYEEYVVRSCPPPHFLFYFGPDLRASRHWRWQNSLMYRKMPLCLNIRSRGSACTREIEYTKCVMLLTQMTFNMYPQKKSNTCIKKNWQKTTRKCARTSMHPMMGHCTGRIVGANSLFGKLHAHLQGYPLAEVGGCGSMDLLVGGSSDVNPPPPPPLFSPSLSL